MVFLPDRGSRQYHRVAVALGAHGEVPLKWGDSGNGFVHVCDEFSIGALFQVLDTITDFVDFLRATEELVRGGVFPLFSGGGIEDLVAFYILQGRSFAFEAFDGKRPDMLIVHDDLWRGLINSEDFKAMQRDLKASYAWDNLIEHYTDDLLTDGMFDMHSKQVTNDELALVTMAMQPRMHRVVLAEAFLQFLQNAELKSAARVVQGHTNSAFIFTAGSSADRDNLRDSRTYAAMSSSQRKNARGKTVVVLPRIVLVPQRLAIHRTSRIFTCLNGQRRMSTMFKASKETSDTSRV